MSASVLAVLFTLWALLSIVCQFRNRWSKWVRGFDSAGLIPTWTFFAPNPVSADYRLYYRDHTENGACEWVRAFDADSRSALDAVWSPFRREEKVISDAMFHLLDLALSVSPLRLHFSTPYLLILGYVTTCRHASQAVGTQFLFTIKRPGQPVRPIFLSDIHALWD